jgi:dCMP deaminase
MLRDTPTWNETMMTLARVMAKRSKDPHTQVGAVLVSPDKKRIHLGYNGFPTGMAENDTRWQSIP